MYFWLAIAFAQNRHDSRRTVKTVSSVKAVSDRLRVKESAAEAHVSIGMIYVWMKEERFKTWKVTQRDKERGTRFIDAKSFRAWLKSQREESV